jgi:hypothetical protein
VRLALLALAVALVGCLGKTASDCGDGTVCPLDKVCVAGGCALQEQIDACHDLVEGAQCTFSGTLGRCMTGVCVGSLCGNNMLDAGELSREISISWFSPKARAAAATRARVWRPARRAAPPTRA